MSGALLYERVVIPRREHFAAAALILAAFVAGSAVVPKIVGMLGSLSEPSRHAKVSRHLFRDMDHEYAVAVATGDFLDDFDQHRHRLRTIICLGCLASDDHGDPNCVLFPNGYFTARTNARGRGGAQG